MKKRHSSSGWAAESGVSVVRPSQNEQNYNANLQLPEVNAPAESTVVYQLALRLKKAESAAPRQRQYTVERRVRHDLIPVPS